MNDEVYEIVVATMAKRINELELDVRIGLIRLESAEKELAEYKKAELEGQLGLD